MVCYDQPWIAVARLRSLDINFVILAPKERIDLSRGLYMLLVVWHLITGIRGSKFFIGSSWLKISRWR